MLIALENKRCENHDLNVATATKVNKEIPPPLFHIIRLDGFTLNIFRFCCEVWVQLNRRRKIRWIQILL